MTKQSWLSPDPAPPARYLYFVNAWVDYAIIGGLSMAAYVLLGLVQPLVSMRTVQQVSVVLVWVCNWPHFAATSYRLYHSKQNVAQYPLTALLVPVVLFAATWACFASPADVAPLFVKLQLTWSPYHFSGQSVGISLIYARRSGFVLGRLERLTLSGFIFGTFAYQTALSEVAGAPRTYYGITYPSLGLPPIVAVLIGVWTLACGVGLLACAIRWCVRSRRSLPPIVLLPAATQFVWFVLGWRVPGFYEFVPFFHGLQYLLIAWAMQLKEQADEHAIPPSRRYVRDESIRWGLLNMAGGAVLFWWLPRLAALLGYALAFAEPVVISAVQIHHFFVDGVIWKLRNPKVSSPLLVNLDQLINPQPQPSGVSA